MAGGINNKLLTTALSIADAASWSCTLALLALILMGSLREGRGRMSEVEIETFDSGIVMKGSSTLVGQQPCDEIYVVSEGETLHSIIDKCGDPFIVERNPHIHDPDDVFPGLVIMITPSSSA
ncbi:Peptidoglycan-binding LysM domain-containing family protein [Rhynchospora pubera]|uniref:Peptidoglycan-binding LysM domain-containing family protein n=1 Tax=Rhynchospora pubera TaxID=906938 RepID=A0AAV8EGE8_9POAL|nr:Peptidoglycan-binding LysM domain-containing family protein [Rhynchospora pubera]